MERVLVMKPLYVEQTGVHYQEGVEYDVPSLVAERHKETGYMQILTQPELVTDNKKKAGK